MQIGGVICSCDAEKSAVVMAMTGEQRIGLASHLTFIEREITKTRLREEHPDWSEKRLQIEMFRLAFLPDPLPKWLQQRFMEDCEQFRLEFTVE